MVQCVLRWVKLGYLQGIHAEIWSRDGREYMMLNTVIDGAVEKKIRVTKRNSCLCQVYVLRGVALVPGLSSVPGDTQQRNNTTRTHGLGFLMRLACSLAVSGRRATNITCTEVIESSDYNIPQERRTSLSRIAGTSTTRG